MSRILLIDVGAGTMDVLFHDMESGLQCKAVVRSPVLTVAEQITRTPGNLLIKGVEMGGGSLAAILRQRALRDEVLISASAAMTLHHQEDRVRSWGIRVIPDAEADEFRPTAGFSVLTFADLDRERLRSLFSCFGVPFEMDSVGVCAQDHGIPPPGSGHLDHRHRVFAEALDRDPFPHALLFPHDEIPGTFHRLQSIARCAMNLPTPEAWVMDSGMAAILGASMDSSARRAERVLVLDAATSHTVGAALDRGEITGFFEYHTRDVTLPRIESLLEAVADGKLRHSRILEEGGHGAYIRKALGFDRVQDIVATGPRRRILDGSRLSIRFAAPGGDNMMTGNVGLLAAICRRKGLPSPQWI